MGKTTDARALRTNMADAELALWGALRMRQIQGWRFRRQHRIGRFIVDFVCLEARLVVEVDGGQHATQVWEDETRTAWLISEDYTVMRFWNNEVLQQRDAVVETIREWLTHHPHPSLPP